MKVIALAILLSLGLLGGSALLRRLQLALGADSERRSMITTLAAVVGIAVLTLAVFVAMAGTFSSSFAEFVARFLRQPFWQ